jgi:hypothetical protein
MTKEEPKEETLEEAAKLYIGVPITRIIDDEERYYTSNIGEYDAFIQGAKWQQEQDNKELAMWKLAVEKQEARCTALRGVISDLQDKNKYSEEEVISILHSFHKEDNSRVVFSLFGITKWFEKFKKK